MQRYVKVQHAVPGGGRCRDTHTGDSDPARQRGAYGVEFAAVFLAFFLAFYAVLTWGLIFTARQSLQVAAEEGARASLRYQAAGTTVLPQIQARLATACSLVDRASNWVGSLSGQATECKATVAGAGVCGGTGACCREFERNVPAGAGTCQAPTSGWTVMVRVVYPNYGARPLLPVFPGFGALLPSQLSAQAEIWIPPTSLDRGI